MKTSILSKLVGRRKEAKEKKRIFNLSEARVEEHYAFGDIIGQGNFGKVKMGTHFKTNKKVAIKIIEKTNDVKLDSLKTEVKILMNVKHQNIVSLLDVFEDEDRLYLIMELMTGGELFERICKDYPNGYSEREAADLSRQIIESVKYLHSKGIIHRDLKPENLLLAAANDATTSTQVKISDFGLAKIWSGDALARTTCGSPNYVAPEVLLNEVRGYTSVVDMWSVGVIIYVLLCGFCPFFDENTPTLFKSIIAGQYTFPDPYWKDISSEAKEFIRKLLVVNPDHRMTPDQALKHPWIADNRHNAPIADIAKNMEHFKATRSSANLKQLDNEDEDDD